MRIAGHVILVLPFLASFVCGAEQSPMPTQRNRLGDETSPYLRSHADNPVHWYAWGPEAFERARAENKPVFLSIGYSSCHWCHVMNRESFADEKIAAILNEHFICIKVDREERPDVDKLYMNAVQAINGHGGWPLSAFLLPDGSPFFGGTYFPPADKEVPGGVMPGFPRVLESVLDALKNKREEIERQAAGLNGYLRHQATAVILNPVEVTPDLVEKAVAAMSEQIDPLFAGFAGPPNFAPKFPQPAMGLFLIEHATISGKSETLKPVIDQAQRMARGGIYDQVGGGFHRYSVDREWIVPHFEKMLYDQAQLLSFYALLHRQSPDPLYERVLRETISFLRREMMAPEQMFYSALDADTEHEEGKFYVWETAELKEALGEDFTWVANLTGVTAGANFESHHILVLDETIAEIARQRGVSETKADQDWEAAKQKLLALRAKRVRPLLDTKVITAWNGLTIVGLADAAEVLDDAEIRQLAVTSARKMLQLLRKEDGTLYRHWIDGKGKGDGFADDYAATILALQAAHRLQGDPEFSEAIVAILQQLTDRFADPKGGGFFYTGKGQENLVAPLKDNYDGAMPSANSLAALALVWQSRQTGDKIHAEQAMKTIAAFSNDLNNSPGSSAVMMRALDLYYQTTTSKSPAAASTTPPAPGNTDPNEPIHLLRVVPEKLETTAGGTVSFAVNVQLNDTWHINANPASPSYLKPTVLKLVDNKLASELQVQYPKAKLLEQDGVDMPISVYDGKVSLPASLKISADATPGSHTVELELQYQPCDDKRCLAPTKRRIPVSIEILAK